MQGNTFNGASQLLQLNGSGQVPVANLASGTPDGTKFLKDDGSWDTPAGGGGSYPQYIGSTNLTGTFGTSYSTFATITPQARASI
jgi:hypothetical protein